MLFTGIGMMKYQYEELIPTYEQALKKYDSDILSEVIFKTVEQWTSNKPPSVGKLIEQCKYIKFRKSQKNDGAATEEAIKATAKFWAAYEECKMDPENIRDFDKLTQCVKEKFENKLKGAEL